MSVEDDVLVGAQDDTTDQPPKPSRYQLDIDAPLLRRSDAPPSSSAAGTTERPPSSLTWSKITEVTSGSVPAVHAPKVAIPHLDDVHVPPPDPDVVPVERVDDALVALVGQIVAESPDPDVALPSGAPVHRLTKSTPLVVPTPPVGVPVTDAVEAELVEPEVEVDVEATETADADVSEPVEVAEPVVVDAAPTAEPVSGAVDTLADVPDAPVSEPVDLIIEVDDPVQVPVDPRSLTLSNSTVYQPVAPSVPRTAAPASFAPDPAYLRPTKRRRRNPIGTILKLVIVLGVVAGTAWAVREYVLAPVSWPDDLAELAATVEEVHGLTFTDSVPVVAVPLVEYQAQLGAWVTTEAGDDWAAFGVAPPGQPSSWVGRAAVIDTPAFYDPETKQIVELEGMPTLVREVALARALSAALLDQTAQWSAGLVDTGLSQRVALEAVVDGAGRNVAASMLEGTERADWETQTATFAASLPVAPVGPTSPYLTAMVGGPGRASEAVTAGLQGDELLAVVERPPADDAGVIDPARTPLPATEATASRGMLFWYAALAGRIDPNGAWLALTGWTSDSVVPIDGATRPCWSATLVAADSSGADLLQFGFQIWADAGVGTDTVSRPSPTTVQVEACTDPNVAPAPINDFPALGGAPVERALVTAATGAQTITDATTRCVVTTARGAAVPWNDPANAVPALTLDGWTPPWVTSNAAAVEACQT